ncbi:ankyrin repeat domain-containing protein 26 isoform X2 [Hyaena hyaena]|uniref:ankyrin repeat domain-containing protein 26 isoform X2 n=1 Tax=Hyaena hyaena TaxID=95912 RepID=UPI0019217FF9|nr:ankyrin repeat domain-containing protein 26 isoform X2 [Hyaena hyaena]
MKKIFGLGAKKGESPLGSTCSSRRNGKDVARESNTLGSSQSGYHIRERDLGKLHRAANVGNVAKVQHILWFGSKGLDERDRKRRTALHLACANGHSEVVTVLVERKCQLNLRDSEERTALMKAVQCPDEKSVTILLEHGADPNLMDNRGNTALHYAVFGENISIAEKLLLHNADIEARNKAGLTPLLLAINENKEQMVEFLAEKKADVYTVNNIKSDHQPISSYKEEKTPKNSSQSSHPDESSEEDSLRSRLSKKSDVDDSWPTSDSEDYNFGAKNVPKPNLRELMLASQQHMKNTEAKCGTVRPEDKNSDSKHEDVAETLSKPPVRDYDCSHPAFPSSLSLGKPSLSPSAVFGLAGKGTAKSAVDEKLNEIINENAPQEQAVNHNLNSAHGAQKNTRSDMMSTLGLGEDGDVDSPWSSESISENANKNVVHLSGATYQKEQSILNGQVEDVFYIPSCMNGSRNFKMAKLEDTRNVGIPVAHLDPPEKYPDLKPTVEVEDSVPDKTVGKGAIQISSSDFSIWASTNLTLANENSQTIEDLTVNDKCLPVSQPVTENQSASKEKINIGTLLLLENWKVHDLCESQLPENRESKEDLSTDLQLEMTSEEEQERPDGSENNHPQVEEEKKQHRSSEMEVSENDAAASGFTQQRKNGKTVRHQFPIIENEDSNRLAKKISNKKNKVKKQINSMDDFDDFSHSSKTEASEDCELPYSNYEYFKLLIEQLGMDCKDSVALLKIQNAVLSYERLIKVKKSHCKRLMGKIKKMEKKGNALRKELSETKEMKSQLECQKVKWDRELCTLRLTLKQEEEKRRHAEKLYEKIREELRRTQEQYTQEVEMKLQLEATVRTLHMELKAVKNHLNKVPDSHEEKQDLLHTNHMLQDEIAMLRMEIDTIKNQNQGKEKKYCGDIETLKEKNDSLQKTIKQNEETLPKTIFQYNGQLNVLTAEIQMLKSQLENEKQNKERLEEELESYHARLATAIPDHDQSKTSRRDLELDFQRARDEKFCLQAKMNFDMSSLKDNNEILSQQLAQVETKFNSLEIEFHHTKEALREKTLALERVQRDLSQIECQKKEIEHMYQNEQSKVNKYIGKQESLEERLSQLQSENMLLRQQLDDAYNKAEDKEKRVIIIEDHFQAIIKKLQGESEKQGLMLEERNKELIDECTHLKERIHQYENEKAEREVAVRQLQEELADSLKKKSMSEASLEVISCYRLSLEDERQDLKKKLGQFESQLQEAQDQHTDALRQAEKMEDHLQKLQVENAKSKVTITKQADTIEQLQKNLSSTCLSEDEREQLEKFIELKQSLEYRLDQEMKKNGELEKEITGFKKLFEMTRRKLNESESGELCSHGDLTKQIEMNIQINMLKHKVDDLTTKLEAASSQYLCLDAKNQALQQELLSMKALEKKCEKLERNKNKLEQEVVNLNSLIEMYRVQNSQVEQYKREIEERARLDVVEKLQEVNLFLQIQAASQGKLRENETVRSQMELRIKDLESELFKKTYQETSNLTELEKYQQLYLEEVKARESLANKLNKSNEKLEEINFQLLMEKQQHRTLLTPLNVRPALEPRNVGNLKNSSGLHRNLTPSENLVIPTSNRRPSIDTYLTKMQQELDKVITREFEKAAVEFEAESPRTFPLGSADSTGRTEDLIAKTSQEYVEILKKKYMI